MENKWWKKIGVPLVTLILLFFGVDTFTDLGFEEPVADPNIEITGVIEGEYYDTAQELIDYLELYDELPPNYLTKKEAQELGWDAKEGNLWDVAPGKSIGGDYFGNFEGLLPEKAGRDYHEADVNYNGGYRDAERLVFSNDGLYFYTDDHYDSFEEMQPGGEES